MVLEIFARSTHEGQSCLDSLKQQNADEKG